MCSLGIMMSRLRISWLFKNHTKKENRNWKLRGREKGGKQRQSLGLQGMADVIFSFVCEYYISFGFLGLENVMYHELQLCSGFTACHSHSWKSQSFYHQSEFNYTADFLTECGKFTAKQGTLYAYSYCCNADNNILT